MILRLSSGEVYKAYFNYRDGFIELFGKSNIKEMFSCRITTCSISTLANDEEPLMVNSAEVFTSPRDQFNPHEGRKRAFNKAIAVFPKYVRGQMWQQFLKSSPRLRENPATGRAVPCR